MKIFATVMIVAIAMTTCKTSDGGAPEASAMARMFAEYYAALVPSDIEIMHVEAQNTAAHSIIEQLRTLHRGFVVKVGSRYRETQSGIIDEETGRLCVFVGITLNVESASRASIKVSWNRGGRDWSLMTYLLALENGTWKVTGSSLDAIS